MSGFIQTMQGLPALGVGLGLRSEIFEETLAATSLIDWVEITPENYMGRGGLSLERIQRASAVYPMASHGVSLSIGSVDDLNLDYLSQLEALFTIVNPLWFSDHLCFSSVDGSYSNDLLPLPRTKESVRHLSKRIREIQRRFPQPFLVENISYYLNYPEQEMDEAEFLSAILTEADCGLLLDVNNVYVNAKNHQEDPVAFLKKIPLERVVQIHVAGHDNYPEGIVDTHGNAVCQEVWDLLAWVLGHCQPKGVLLERDLSIPPFEELAVELQRIRQLWEQSQKATNLPTLSETMAVAV